LVTPLLLRLTKCPTFLPSTQYACTVHSMGLWKLHSHQRRHREAVLSVWRTPVHAGQHGGGCEGAQTADQVGGHHHVGVYVRLPEWFCWCTAFFPLAPTTTLSVCRVPLSLHGVAFECSRCLLHCTVSSQPPPPPHTHYVELPFFPRRLTPHPTVDCDPDVAVLSLTPGAIEFLRLREERKVSRVGKGAGGGASGLGVSVPATPGAELLVRQALNILANYTRLLNAVLQGVVAVRLFPAHVPGIFAVETGAPCLLAARRSKFAHVRVLPLCDLIYVHPQPTSLSPCPPWCFCGHRVALPQLWHGEPPGNRPVRGVLHGPAGER
jgi:hypothetical protein